ncbi:hypothetical protein D046_6069A, partial [Vibrio parahaemolyticus V-223/04]
MIPAFIKLVTS